MRFFFLACFVLCGQAAHSQERLTLYDCQKRYPELHDLVMNHQRSPRNYGSFFDYEQKLKSMQSCQDFVDKLKQEAPERVEPRRQEPRREEPRHQEPRREEPRRNNNRGDDRRQSNSVPEARDGVLIVTDEVSPRAASIVRESFYRVAPFSCLNINVAIHHVSVEELGCNPYSNGHPRIVACTSQANSRVRNWKRIAKAKHVIIVVDSHVQGGNGGVPATVTSAIILGYGPLSGLHELMHNLGFQDINGHGASRDGGDIMGCTGPSCRVNPNDYARIARGFGGSLPSDCR